MTSSAKNETPFGLSIQATSSDRAAFATRTYNQKTPERVAWEAENGHRFATEKEMAAEWKRHRARVYTRKRHAAQKLKEAAVEKDPQAKKFDIHTLGSADQFTRLGLTEKDKAEIARRIDEGEWTADSIEVKQLVVTLHKEDPLLFAAKFLKDHLTDQSTGEISPSPEFHKEILSLYLKERRLGIAAPRGHAKSTITSFIYLLHAVLYQRKRNVVIISASEDMAKRFLRRLREELTHNKFIVWAFGLQMSDKWSETELRLANGAVIHAKGRGAQLRGLIDGARRPDLIILDDIEDEEEVRSELRRYDLESWFNGTVLPTLEPKVGQCIFIGTVLHEDSLLARVIDGKTYPEFVARRYSAIIQSPDGTEVPLWPDRFSLTSLMEIKKGYMARSQLPQFYMEYMNDPMPLETAVFRSQYFNFFEDLPAFDPRNPLVTEMFVDLGGGSVSGRADYTAMVVTICDTKNNMYVTDYVNKKYGTDVPSLVRDLIALYKKHGATRVVIEKTVAANMLRPTLESIMFKEGAFLNIEYVTPPKGTGDRRGNMSDAKYQRISAMEGAFKMGAIKIRKWMSELMEQLMAFPRATHDDLCDALAYGYSYAVRRMEVAARHVGLGEVEEDGDYDNLYDELGL